jgi:hypothetical protein
MRENNGPARDSWRCTVFNSLQAEDTRKGAAGVQSESKEVASEHERRNFNSMQRKNDGKNSDA